MANILFNTYKNSVIMRGHHSYQASYDMYMETMC